MSTLVDAPAGIAPAPARPQPAAARCADGDGSKARRFAAQMGLNAVAALAAAAIFAIQSDMASMQDAAAPSSIVDAASR